MSTQYLVMMTDQISNVSRIDHAYQDRADAETKAAEINADDSPFTASVVEETFADLESE